MKKTILLISVLFILLFCACADASVAYNLGENNEVNIEYTLDLKSIELDARNYANSVSEYWQAQGLDSKADLDSDHITVSGEKTIASDNRQAAAAAFAQTLTSQGSIFNDVDFSYTPAFEEDVYDLSANVSLVDIIRQVELQDIPSNELKALISQAQDGIYTLSISMPGEIIDTNADETEANVCRWNLEYGKETQISMHTRLVNTQAINEYSDVTEKLSIAGMLLRLLIGAAGLILLVIIVLIIVSAVKKTRG